MPRFEAFHDGFAYYSTLGHEATHWTGAKCRLDRDVANRFGSNAYAAEELIAELGAAFLCSALKMSNAPRADHAAYIAGWLELLRSDKHAIFTAAEQGPGGRRLDAGAPGRRPRVRGERIEHGGVRRP